MGKLRLECHTRCGQVEAGMSQGCGQVEAGMSQGCGQIEAGMSQGCGQVEAGMSQGCGQVEAARFFLDIQQSQIDTCRVISIEVDHQ